MSRRFTQSSTLRQTVRHASHENAVLTEGVGQAAFRRAIFRLASRIEPNPVAVAKWFSGDPIADLGGQTAQALLTSGEAWAVIRFLHRICRNDDQVLMA